MGSAYDIITSKELVSVMLSKQSGDGADAEEGSYIFLNLEGVIPSIFLKT